MMALFSGDWAYAILVVVLGYVAFGITGFASALVCVPLLAWRWPLIEVVPLILMTDVSSSLVLGGLNFRRVAWGEFGRMLPGIVLGVLLGLALLPHVTAGWPLLVLGLYVAAVGVRALRPPAAGMARVAPAWHGVIFGLATGVVEVLFATPGPLVLAWLARRRVDTYAMRASVPAFIVLVTPVVLVLLALDGQLSAPLMWHRFGVLVPVAVVASVVGHLVAYRLPVKVLRTAICGLLVLSGGMLALNALRAMA